MTCVHHWLCEPPNGPLIPARCKRCGLERTYQADPIDGGDTEFRQSLKRGRAASALAKARAVA